MNSIIIPHASPVRFVKMNASTEDYKHFDEVLYEDQILDFQEKIRYYQKWKNSDTVSFPVISNFGVPSIKLVDCELKQVVACSVESVSTDYYQSPDVYYMAQADLTGVDEGIYWFLIDVSGEKFLSEPQYIAEQHDNTILFNYDNDKNEFGLVFDGFSYSFRCEAILSEFLPGSKEKVFEDEPANIYTLSSNPFRVFKLIIGDAKGVPDWVADKINRIFACKKVLLDQKQFGRTDGSKMERNGDPLVPTSGWTMEIRESKARDVLVMGNDRLIETDVTMTYVVDTTLFGSGYNANAKITQID